MEDDNVSEGWRRDGQGEVRRLRHACTTGGTQHHTSEVEMENPPEGRRAMVDIRKLIEAQEIKKDETDMQVLETAARIERKMRMELSWKTKREHYKYRTWAMEWLMDTSVDSAVTVGSRMVDNTVHEVITEICNGGEDASKEKSARRMTDVSL